MTPAGLVIEAVMTDADKMLVATRVLLTGTRCRGCGQASTRAHSRYCRQILDLPSHGRSVQLRVEVRGFRCGNSGCTRQIFAEPLHRLEMAEAVS